MSIWNGIWTRIKNFIFHPPAEDGNGKVESAVSRRMADGINLWYSMYVGQPPWATDRVKPLGIPAAICRELVRPTFLEFTADITGGARATFIQELFNNALEHFPKDIEMGLSLGGVALRPYVVEDRILIDASGPAAFTPIRFNEDETCVSGVFKDKVQKVGKNYYVRLEYHDFTDGLYTVKNKVYRCNETGTNLGEEVPLSVVPELADYEPEVTIANLTGPLFSYFKTPVANNVDTNSDVGVSVYSGDTVELIKQADEQWALLQWEYQSGKRRIFMDGVGATADQFDRELFEIGSFSSSGDFYEIFSPEFRDEPLYRGFQNILRRIEFNTGLSYGTISDPQTVAMTATEIRSSKQRMYVTVDAIQKALTHTFDALLYAMDVQATLNGLGGSGGYEAAFNWGDSVLDDEETRQARNADMRADVAAGLLRGELYIAQKYGVTEEEAKSMMPGMEELTTEKQDEVE